MYACLIPFCVRMISCVDLVRQSQSGFNKKHSFERNPSISAQRSLKRVLIHLRPNSARLFLDTISIYQPKNKVKYKPVDNSKTKNHNVVSCVDRLKLTETVCYFNLLHIFYTCKACFYYWYVFFCHFYTNIVESVLFSGDKCRT